jgi:hypothetical protein
MTLTEVKATPIHPNKPCENDKRLFAMKKGRGANLRSNKLRLGSRFPLQKTNKKLSRIRYSDFFKKSEYLALLTCFLFVLFRYNRACPDVYCRGL